MNRHEIHLLKKEAMRYYKLCVENINNKDLCRHYERMWAICEAKLEEVTKSNNL